MKNPFKISWVRLAVRSAALLLFLLLSLSGVLPGWLQSGGDGDSFAPLKEPLPGFLKAILPSLSPFALLDSSLAQRALVSLAPLALCLGVLLLAALFKGRLFCGWICPMGTLMELQARLFPKGRLKSFPRLGGVVFWIAVSGAALGAPLLLWLDPLSSFNRLTVLLHWPFSLALLLPASLAVFALALGFLKPMTWCVGLCPLGYALSLPGRLKSWLSGLRKGQAEAGNVSEMRRDILKGVCLGVPLSLATSYAPSALAGKGAGRIPVLPPGALDMDSFHAACTRCYACVNACPSKVLTAEFPQDARVTSWFAPRLSADKSSCWEHCNRCSSVCAPGAIRHVTVDRKRQLQIGVAVVEPARCLAWAKGQHCMVCQPGVLPIQRHRERR